jgi:hypothetical protein
MSSSMDTQTSTPKHAPNVNIGYATTLSPNSSVEIKRPDCKHGEDCFATVNNN